MDRADSASALSARRLFVAALPARGSEVGLGSESAQHARVLRLSAGDPVQLFDGRGGTVEARVVALDKRALACVAVAEVVHVPPPPRVVLVQCLPRAGKLDDIVRMTTEIGVSAIELAVSEHCVARGSGRDDHKRDRLERVAVEAARQSEQAYVPEIGTPAPLAEVLGRAPAAAHKVAALERTAAAWPLTIDAPALWVVVGPEGGLSQSDRAQIAAAGFVPASFGRSILRTETAAVVGVTLAVERLGRSR
ncbi:MAG: RsmE family RNA methyltransferase [Polyangiales bacterium]